MLLFYLILPTFVLSDEPIVVRRILQTNVKGTFKGVDTELIATLDGLDVEVIKENERKAFGIDDETLRDGIRMLNGARPDDVFVRSPTPWGDLYKTYKWKQVTRLTEPVHATMNDISTSKYLLAKQSFENNSSKPLKVNVALSKSVNMTITSSWPKRDNLELDVVCYNFSIDFDLESNRIVYFDLINWGKSFQKLIPEDVGSLSEMMIELSPQQKVTAYLEAKLGLLEIDFDYSSKLFGAVAVNYEAAYNDHHFYRFPVHEVMVAKKRPIQLKATHRLKLEFYYDTNIVIKDKQENVISSQVFKKDYFISDNDKKKLNFASSTGVFESGTEQPEKKSIVLKMKKNNDGKIGGVKQTILSTP